MGPEASPCKKRDTIKNSKLGARPQDQEKRVKKRRERQINLTAPTLFVSHPVMGSAIALPTANEVIT